MSILPHVTFGAVIGSFIPNPYLAASAGFLSHFILDFIPHWDPTLKGLTKNKKLFFSGLFLMDLTLSLGVLWWVREYPNIFWAGLTGALVDLENFYKFIPWHVQGSIWHKITNWKLGLFNQTWVVGLSLLFLIYSLHA